MQREHFESIKPWERYSVSVLAASRTAPKAVFSHQSAAVLQGLALINTHQIKVHTYCRADSRDSIANHCKHVRLTPDTQILKTIFGAQTTDYVTTIIDCAQEMNFEEGVVLADSALFQGKVSLQELKHKMMAYNGRNKNKVHRVAEVMSDKAESPGETITRMRLNELGIRFIEQYEMQVFGRSYRADFYLPDYGIIIEFDGNIKYTDFGEEHVVVGEERRRERELLNTGVRVFRTTWNDVYRFPANFHEHLAQALT